MDVKDHCKCCKRVHTNITLSSSWVVDDEDDDDDELLQAALEGVGTDLTKDASLSWFDDLTVRHFSSSNWAIQPHIDGHGIQTSAQDAVMGQDDWSPCPRGGRFSSPDVKCNTSVADPLSSVFGEGTPRIARMESSPQMASSPSVEQLATDQSDVKWTSAMATPPCGSSTSFSDNGRLNDTSLDPGDVTTTNIKVTHRKLFSPMVTGLPPKHDDSLIHLSDLDVTKETDVTILQEDGDTEFRLGDTTIVDDKNDETLKPSVENTAATESVVNNGVEKREHIETMLNSLFGSPSDSIEMGLSESAVENVNNGEKLPLALSVGEKDLDTKLGHETSQELECVLDGGTKKGRHENCRGDNDAESDLMSDSLCLSALLDGEKSLKYDRESENGGMVRKRKEGAAKKLYQTEDEKSNNDPSENDKNIRSCDMQMEYTCDSPPIPLPVPNTGSGSTNTLLLSKSNMKKKSGMFYFDPTERDDPVPVSILKSPNTPKANYSRNVRFSLPSEHSVAASSLLQNSTFPSVSLGTPDNIMANLVSEERLDERCHDHSGMADLINETKRFKELESKKCESRPSRSNPCAVDSFDYHSSSVKKVDGHDNANIVDGRSGTLPIPLSESKHNGDDDDDKSISGFFSEQEDNSFLSASPTFSKEVGRYSQSSRMNQNKDTNILTKKVSGDANSLKVEGSHPVEDNVTQLPNTRLLEKGPDLMSCGDGPVKEVLIPTSSVCSKGEISCDPAMDPVDVMLMAAYDVSCFGDGADNRNCSSGSIKDVGNRNELHACHSDIDNVKDESSDRLHKASSSSTLSFITSLPSIPTSNPISMPVGPSMRSSSSPLSSPSSCSATITTPSVIKKCTPTNNSTTRVINRSSSAPSSVKNETRAVGTIASDSVIHSNSIINSSSLSSSSSSSSSSSVICSSSSSSNFKPNYSVTFSCASNLPLSTKTTLTSFSVKPRKFLYPKKGNKITESKSKTNLHSPLKPPNNESTSKSILTDISETRTTPTSVSVCVSSSTVSDTNFQPAVTDSCNNNQTMEKNVCLDDSLDNNDDGSSSFWSKEAQHLFDDDIRNVENEAGIASVEDRVIVPVSTNRLEAVNRGPAQCVTDQTEKYSSKRKPLPKLLGFARFTDVFGDSSPESELNSETYNQSVKGVDFTSHHQSDSTKSESESNILTSDSDRNIGLGPTAGIVSCHNRTATRHTGKEGFETIKEKANGCHAKGLFVGDVTVSETLNCDYLNNKPNENEAPKQAKMKPVALAIVSNSNVRHEVDREEGGEDYSVVDEDGKNSGDGGVPTPLDDIPAHLWELPELSHMTTPPNMNREKPEIGIKVDDDGDGDKGCIERDELSCKTGEGEKSTDGRITGGNGGGVEGGHDKNYSPSSVLHQQPNQKSLRGSLIRGLNNPSRIDSNKKRRFENSSVTSKLKSFDELFFGCGSKDTEISGLDQRTKGSVEEEFENVLKAGSHKKAVPIPDSKRYPGFQRAGYIDEIHFVSEIPRVVRNEGGEGQDMENELENVLASLQRKSFPQNDIKILGKDGTGFQSSRLSMKSKRETSTFNDKTRTDNAGTHDTQFPWDRNEFESILSDSKEKTSFLLHKDRKLTHVGESPITSIVQEDSVREKDLIVDQFETTLTRMKRKNPSDFKIPRRLCNISGKGFVKSRTKMLKSEEILNCSNSIQRCDEKMKNENGRVEILMETNRCATVSCDVKGQTVVADKSEQMVTKGDEKVEKDYENENPLSMGDIYDSEENEQILVSGKKEYYCLQSEQLYIDSGKRFGNEKIKSGFQTAEGKEIALSVKAQNKAVNLWDTVNVCNSMSERPHERSKDVALWDFCMARGNAIKLSEKSEKKASGLLDSVCSENSVSFLKPEQYSCMSEKNVTEEGSAGMSSALRGFATAGGKRISMSEEAKEKAKSLWESVGSENVSLISNVGKDDGGGISDSFVEEWDKHTNNTVDSFEGSLAKVLGGASNCKGINCSGAEKQNQRVDKRHKGFRPFVAPKMVKKKKDETSSGLNVSENTLDPNDDDQHIDSLFLALREHSVSDSRDRGSEEKLRLDRDWGDKVDCKFSEVSGSKKSSSDKAAKEQACLDTSAAVECARNDQDVKLTSVFCGNLSQAGVMDESVDELMKSVEETVAKEMASKVQTKSEGLILDNTEQKHECDFDDGLDSQMMAELDMTDAVEQEVHLNARSGNRGVNVLDDLFCSEPVEGNDGAGVNVPQSEKDLKTSFAAETRLTNEKGFCQIKQLSTDFVERSMPPDECTEDKNKIKRPSFGFSTAAGDEVFVSDKSLKIAKNILNEEEDNLMKVKEPVLGKDNAKTASFDGFSSASVSKTSVSVRAQENVKYFPHSRDEEMLMADRNKDMTGNQMALNDQKYIGFSTAAGSKVSVSESALVKARGFLNDDDEGKMKEIKSVSLSEMYEKTVEPVKLPFCFTTAAGSTVSVSEKALKKAKCFLNDDLVDAGNPGHQSKSNSLGNKNQIGFTTAAGEAVTVSEKALLKAKNVLCDAEDDKGEEKNDHERVLSSRNELSKPRGGNFMGFSTAAGSEVSVSEDALVKAKSFLNDDNFCNIIKSGDRNSKLAGFSTAAGSEVSISEDALAKTKSFFNDDGNNNNGCIFRHSDVMSGNSKFAGFSTASGSDVSVSKTSLEARAFLKDDCDYSKTKQSSLNKGECLGEHRNPAIATTSLSTSNLSIPRKALEQAEMLLLGKDKKKLVAGGPDTRGNEGYSCRGPSTNSPGGGRQLPSNLDPTVETKTDDCSLYTSKKAPLISRSEEILNDRSGGKRRRLTAVRCNATTRDQTPHVSTTTTTTNSVKTNAERSSSTLPQQSSSSSFVPPASTTSCHSKSLVCDPSKSNISTSSTSEEKYGMENKHPVFFSKSKRDQDGIRRSSRRKSNSLYNQSCKNSVDMSAVPSLLRGLEETGRNTDQEDSRTDRTVSYVQTGNTRVGGEITGESVTKQLQKKPGPSIIVDVENIIPDDELDDEEENKFLCENISTQIGCGSSYDVEWNLADDYDEAVDDRLRTGDDDDDKKGNTVCGTKNGEGLESNRVKGFEICDDEDGSCVKSVVGRNKTINTSHGVSGRAGSDGCGHSDIGGAMVNKDNGGAETIMYPVDESALTEARMMQEKIIRGKKKRRVIPRPGRLMEERKMNRSGERYDLKSLEGWPDGRKFTREELLCRGVSEATLSVNCGNAASYQFDLRRFYPGGVPVCVLVGDGASLVHDGKGFAGYQEFYKAFLTLDGVDPNLVDENWVRNHYRWIVWKLAAYEVNFPAAFAGRALTPHSVVLQLKYRCDREVDGAQRSAIKKIVEKDDTCTKRLVLCVAGIRKKDDGQILLEMTDGWYSIWCKLDTPLSNLVTSTRLSVGIKLITSGAELEGAGQGCAPLEMGEDVQLSLHANSTRPAPCLSRLGFQSNPMALCVPLSSLHSNGGMLGCVDVVVTRIYPMMYMEKQEEGKYVFRTQEEEDAEIKSHSERREREVERIYHSIQGKMEEEEEKQNTKMKRRAWSRREVEELSSGEELLNAWETSFNQEDLQMLLSEIQLRKLLDHQQERVSEKQARIAQRVREAIGNSGASQDRRVMPVQKLRLVGCCNKDIDLQCECLLTVWRPNADWGHVLEGQRYRMFHLAVSPSRGGNSNSFHHQQHMVVNACSVSLASTRQTRIQKLAIGDNLLDLIHKPRELLTVREISSVTGGSEFDFLGLAVRVEPPKDDDRGKGRPLLISCVDKHGDVMVIKMWRKLQSKITFVKENQCFIALNLVKCRLRMEARRKEAVTAEVRPETTRFSTTTSMGCKHGQALVELREYLAKTPSFIEKAKEVVDQTKNSVQQNDVVGTVGNATRAVKSPVPCTSLDGFFEEDDNEDFPPEIVDKIFQQLTPNGSLRLRPSPGQETSSTTTQQQHSQDYGDCHRDVKTSYVAKNREKEPQGEFQLMQTNNFNESNLLGQDRDDDKCVDKADDSENNQLSGDQKLLESITGEEEACLGSKGNETRTYYDNVEVTSNSNNKHVEVSSNNASNSNTSSVIKSNDEGGSSRIHTNTSTSSSSLKRKRPVVEEIDEISDTVTRRVKMRTTALDLKGKEVTQTITTAKNVVKEENANRKEEEENGDDFVLRRRKRNLREKMSKLLSYGRPQSLTPLPGSVVSPACVKQFKSPHSST